MTCKDCIHHGVCRFTYDETDPIDIYASSTTYTAEKHCDDFFKADWQEVKHGKWYVDSDFACSVCDGLSEHKYDYCPHCGARMDGQRK